MYQNRNLHHRMKRYTLGQHVATLLLGILSLTPWLAQAQSDEALLSSGQWRDPQTKLIWMRCSIGQRWTGEACAENALHLYWPEAMEYPSLYNDKGFGGKNNWRLPTIAELSTLLHCSDGYGHEIKVIGDLQKDLGIKMRQIPASPKSGMMNVPAYCAKNSVKPTIDTNVFANTPNDFYWSSSPVAGRSEITWIVNFYLGLVADVDARNGGDRGLVRLVRDSK